MKAECNCPNDGKGHRLDCAYAQGLLTNEGFVQAVEAWHAQKYPQGCPRGCEACSQRLGVEATPAYKRAEHKILKEIGEIFGLDTFTVTATMQDGSDRTCILYAETWQAAGRQAERMMPGAKTIVIMKGLS